MFAKIAFVLAAATSFAATACGGTSSPTPGPDGGLGTGRDGAIGSPHDAALTDAAHLDGALGQHDAPSLFDAQPL